MTLYEAVRPPKPPASGEIEGGRATVWLVLVLVLVSGMWEVWGRSEVLLGWVLAAAWAVAIDVLGAFWISDRRLYWVEQLEGLAAAPRGDLLMRRQAQQRYRRWLRVTTISLAGATWWVWHKRMTEDERRAVRDEERRMLDDG